MNSLKSCHSNSVGRRALPDKAGKTEIGCRDFVNAIQKGEALILLVKSCMSTKTCIGLHVEGRSGLEAVS